MSQHDLGRMETHDMELGITDALRRHIARSVVPPKPVSQRRLELEASRPRWLRECIAEASGVFMFVFPGLAAIASLTTNGFFFSPDRASTPQTLTGVNLPDPKSVAAFGSLLQVGWAFAIGIALAIITCAPTSGGHFNPAVTLCLSFWQGFPLKKVPYYVLSQIVGAFTAALLVAGMYWPQLSAMRDLLLARDAPLFGPGTPCAVLAPYPDPVQTSMGTLVLVEFMVDAFIGFVIWAALDPANPFVAGVGVPFVIGLAYGTMIWGFGGLTLSTNLARDLGARAVAAALFGGSGAFTYRAYAPIGILVNIPATFLATAFYELVMRDSIRSIGEGHARHRDGLDGLKRYLDAMGELVEEVTEEVQEVRRQSQPTRKSTMSSRVQPASSFGETDLESRKGVVKMSE